MRQWIALQEYAGCSRQSAGHNSYSVGASQLGPRGQTRCGSKPTGHLGWSSPHRGARAYPRCVQRLVRRILNQGKKSQNIGHCATGAIGKTGTGERFTYAERNAREKKDRACPYTESFPSTLFLNPACSVTCSTVGMCKMWKKIECERRLKTQGRFEDLDWIVIEIEWSVILGKAKAL